MTVKRLWTFLILGLALALPFALLAHEANDPVCGMKVDADKTEFSADYGGQKYFFCSPACLKSFRESPAKYVSLSKLTARVDGADYTLLVTPQSPAAGETIRMVLQGNTLNEDRLEEADAGTRPEGPVSAWLFTAEGGNPAGKPTLHRMHPLPEENAYGFQAAADQPGELALSVTVRLKNGADHRMGFRIPVGAARQPVRPADPIHPKEFTMEAQHATMRRIGDHWLDLKKGLDAKNPSEAVVHFDAIYALAPNLPKFMLHHHEERKAEFDAMAKEFMEMLGGLRKPLIQTNDEARRRVREIEANSCVKCHLAFQWGAVPDLSRFPDLTKPEDRPEEKKK